MLLHIFNRALSPIEICWRSKLTDLFIQSLRHSASINSAKVTTARLAATVLLPVARSRLLHRSRLCRRCRPAAWCGTPPLSSTKLPRASTPLSLTPSPRKLLQPPPLQPLCGRPSQASLDRSQIRMRRLLGPLPRQRRRVPLPLPRTVRRPTKDVIAPASRTRSSSSSTSSGRQGHRRALNQPMWKALPMQLSGPSAPRPPSCSMRSTRRTPETQRLGQLAAAGVCAPKSRRS